MRIFLLLVLALIPGEAFSMSLAQPDEFGAFGGYYQRFRGCRESVVRSEADECAGANGLICGLVDKIDQVQDKMNQVTDLNALVSGLRKKGLWKSAKRAQTKLEELSPRDPTRNSSSYELRHVPDLLSHCKTELADAILHDVTAEVAGDLRDEGKMALAAQLAFTRARIGDLGEAKKLVERLKPYARSQLGSATNDILRRLAMASAELGDFDQSLQVL